MKKLYYTVEFDIEDQEYLTGYKTICVYDIVNNEPQRIASFECANTENSKKQILDNLDSEKYPDVELVIL